MCKMVKDKLRWIDYQESVFEKEDTSSILDNDKERQRAEVVYHWVGKDKKVLDIGGNTGFMSKELAKNQNIVTILELPKVAQQAKQLHPELNIVEGNALELPFNNEEFDTVIACEIIEHIIDIEVFLKEVHRVLKPKGRLIITTPNIVRTRNLLEILCGQQVTGFFHHNETPLHIRFFTFYTLVYTLKKYDFVPLEMAGAETGGEIPTCIAQFSQQELDYIMNLVKRFTPNLVERSSIICMLSEKGEKYANSSNV